MDIPDEDSIRDLSDVRLFIYLKRVLHEALDEFLINHDFKQAVNEFHTGSQKFLDHLIYIRVLYAYHITVDPINNGYEIIIRFQPKKIAYDPIPTIIFKVTETKRKLTFKEKVKLFFETYKKSTILTKLIVNQSQSV